MIIYSIKLRLLENGQREENIILLFKKKKLDNFTWLYVTCFTDKTLELFLSFTFKAVITRSQQTVTVMLDVLTKHLKQWCVDVLYLAHALVPCLHTSRFSVTCFRNELIALFLCPIRCTLGLILSQLEEPLSSVNEVTVNLASAVSKQTFTKSDMTDWHFVCLCKSLRMKNKFSLQNSFRLLTKPLSQWKPLVACRLSESATPCHSSPKIARSYLWTGPQVIFCIMLCILSPFTVADWWLDIITIAEGIIINRLKDCALDVYF